MTIQEKEYLNRILKGLKEMDNSYNKEKLNISKIPKPFRYIFNFSHTLLL